MMVFFEIVTLAVTLLLELVSGGVGLAFFLTAYVLAYFAVTAPALHAWTAAVICGAALDVIWGRPGAIEVLLLPTALGVRLLLFGFTRRDELWSSGLIGAGVGVVGALGHMLAVMFRGGDACGLGTDAALLVFHLIFGAAIFPFCILVLDFFADHIGLTCYRVVAHSRLDSERSSARRGGSGGRRRQSGGRAS